MMLNLNGKAFSIVLNSYLSKETLIVLLDKGYFGNTQSATASLISLIRSAEIYRSICASLDRYPDKPSCFKSVKNRLFESNLLIKEERNVLNEVFRVRNCLVHNVSLFVGMTDVEKEILQRSTTTANLILKKMIYREGFPCSITMDYAKSEMKDMFSSVNREMNAYRNSLKPKVTPIKKEEPERVRETLKII